MLLFTGLGPVSQPELASILDIPNNLNDEDLEELVVACGSFLVVREGVILFFHQSAKDFLPKDKKLALEPGSQHNVLTCRSLEIPSLTLHWNMYRPRAILILLSKTIRRAEFKMF